MEVEVEEPADCPLRFVDSEGIGSPHCQYLSKFATVENWNEVCLCRKDFGEFPDVCPLLKGLVIVKKK